MIPRAADSLLLLPLAVLAGCVTPRDPIERGQPVPVYEAAPTSAKGAPAPPAAVPASTRGVVSQTVDQARQRGKATLDDCFALAQATHEELLAGNEARLQAALQRDLALTELYPTVTLQGTDFRQNRLPPIRGGESFISTAPEHRQISLIVRQPLFQGLREYNDYRSASLGAEAKAAALEEIRLGLLASVAQAFYAVLEAEAEIRTLQEALRVDESRLKEMNARAANGLARRTEVLLLESRRATTQASITRALTTLEIARQELTDLVGVELTTPLAPEDSLDWPIPDKDAAVAEALARRPDMKSAALSTGAAEAHVDSVRGAYAPSVFLNADGYLHRDGFSTFQQQTDWDATVEVDVPIFSHFSTRANERIAESQARQARLAESSLYRAIVQQVLSARATAAASQDLLNTFETNLKFAREDLDLLQAEYRQGIATNLEVLTAQDDVEQAQLNLERQRLESRLDRVELMVALGRMWKR